MSHSTALVRVCLLLAMLHAAGCVSQQPDPMTASNDDTAEAKTSPATSELAAEEPKPVKDEPIAPPEIIEINAEGLLAAQLDEQQLQDGWVRLFDGQSMFGWFVVGKADWKISDGVLSVSRGEKSFLCTSFQIPNYELKVDFRCDPETNSGIFLRTGPQPQSVAVDCLELNIAPPGNPFPTGSFVERKKLATEDLGKFDPTQWHTYHLRLAGNKVSVLLEGKKIIELDDFDAAPTGHISLQHNSGKVEFRNVLLRPISGQSLKLDQDWQSDWQLTAKDDSPFSAEPSESGLRLTGVGQLQSKKHFGDFFLQARYTIARPDVNTGIFFRCVPDAMLDGYECQVNHAVEDGDPLRPKDAGAGAIFRRQPARIVIGDGTEPTYLTLLANGPQMVTWINGVQVADFFDTRPADPNPRKGLRLEPGPIALQGHDPQTEATFQSMKISEL